MQTKRYSVLAALLLSVAFAGEASAQMKSFKIKKTMTFRGIDVPDDPEQQRSKAIFGQNKAWDNKKGKDSDVDVLARTEESFAASSTGNSFEGSHEAKTDSGRAKAKTTIKVGQASGNSNAEVDASIELELQWPGSIKSLDPGGGAMAYGKVEVFRGKVTYNDISVNGIDFEGDKNVRAVSKILRAFGIVIDPLTVRVVGESSGEVIEEEVFRAEAEFGADGAVHWNDSDRLELSIPEASGAFAEYRSETMVSWATDFTGEVRLDEGVLTATGIYLPPSGVLTDYFDLEYSQGTPGYIVKATLKASVIDFDGTAYPPVTTVDNFFVSVGHDLAAAVSEEALHINEIRVSQPGTDLDEYLELASFPYDALDRLTCVVIGDGGAGSGVIEEAISLDGQRTNADGFFVVAEPSFTLGEADLVQTLNFENDDNVTFLLVEDFVGNVGDDLDIDDDCSLDIQPWSAVLDSVALIKEPNPPVTTECHYGDTPVGPDGPFSPGQVFHCGETWLVGDFDPQNGPDTPGQPNVDLLLQGAPAFGNLVHFVAGTQYQTGNLVQVLLSCSGTSGIPLPGSGGEVLPLTYDACTSLSLSLAPLFTGVIAPDGLAHTPAFPFPPVAPGLQLWAAGVTIDGSPSFVSVVGPTQFTTQ